MRRIGFLGTAGAIALFAGCLTEAQAAWKICNKTADDMRVAIAYVNPRVGGFISEGWWTLRACGGCKTVLQASQTSDPHNVFYRAEGGGVVEGRDQFCVGSSPFKMNGTRNCGVKKGFVHKQINIANATSNITGRSSSGRVCFD
jgi:uncharacterized membrane protein